MKNKLGLRTFLSIQALSLQSFPCSVDIMISCLLLAFLLLHLLCLFSSLSQTCNWYTTHCARLLIVATPVVKVAVKSTKVKPHGSIVCKGGGTGGARGAIAPPNLHCGARLCALCATFSYVLPSAVCKSFSPPNLIQLPPPLIVCDIIITHVSVDAQTSKQTNQQMCMQQT